MDLRKPLGNKIKYFRKQKGLTQEQLAEKIGIETNTLSNIETGKSFMSFKVFQKLPDILEVQPYEFFIYPEYMTASHKEELIKKLKKIKNPNTLFLIEKILYHTDREEF